MWCQTMKRSYVLTLLFGPGIIAYAAVVRDPSVARVFLPAGMLDRAVRAELPDVTPLGLPGS